MEETKWLRAFIEELCGCKAPDKVQDSANDGFHDGPYGWESVLRLKAPTADELHVQRSGVPHRVRIRYYETTKELPGRDKLVMDLEVVLLVSTTGEWMPIEFARAKTGRHTYVQIDGSTNDLSVIDAVNQGACSRYCDGWAFHLRKQGWLEKGMVI